MASRRATLLRIALLCALVGGLIALAAATGVRERFSLERIRSTIQASGAWGAALFVVMYCAGELIHVPGTWFVAAAILVYGRLWGCALGFAAGLISVSVTFAVVRGVGGLPFANIDRPILKRLLARLESHPIRSVLLLRLLLMLSPAASYALALSPIRFRDYLIGSAAGLVIPIGLLALFLDQLLRFLTGHH
jgi:uncharacterized membrane protein YdjX (TVP38/TMEM64 family)